MTRADGVQEMQRLRDFLSVASDWLWETDAALRLVWLSHGFFAVTGLAPEAVLGLSCVALDRRGADHPDVRAHLADLEARRPFRGHRLELVDARGRLRILEAAGRPVFDPDRQFLGYRGSAVDVTHEVELERALRESEQRFRSLVTNMRGIVFYRGEAGPGPYGYRSGLSLYGADVWEIAGANETEGEAPVTRWYQAIHPEDRPRYLELERRRKEHGEPYSLDYRIYHPATGELRWVREVAWVSCGPAPGQRFFDGYVLDITEQKRNELALRESERRWRTLIEAAPVAILVAEDGKITLANRSAARLLGAASPEQLLGCAIARFRTKGERLAVPAGTEEHPVQVWRRLDGRRLLCEVGEVELTEGERRTLQYVLVDLTARIEAQERAWYLALHDPLTGLTNRAGFADRLAHALAVRTRRRSRLALHLIDLDGFKEVNDTFGHAAGDELLRQVAQRLRKVVRNTDTLARLGGDEFAVLQLDIAGPEDAAVLAKRLLDGFARPFAIDNQDVHAGASIGLALCPDDAVDAETLLRKADLAMYRAKEQGRGTFAFFVPMLDRMLQLRRAMDAELRRALEHGEIFLLFQPKVDLEDGRIVGAEALVRWRHPGRGLIGPDEFVPVAESGGLIRPLGARVLELACRQLADWRRIGLALPVAVNVSAAQLREDSFVDRLERLLRHYRVEPQLLGIEITESLLVDPGHEQLDQRLRHIAQLGVEVAIDDFGTGYSSLLNLKRMPVQVIKIDRSFVAGIGRDRESESIVEAMVHLAHTLGKTVVAEGVERDEQADFLRARGCRLGQGFLYAPPLSAEALPAFAASRSSPVVAAR
ncbi:putative signaling protein [bacterium HR40]|nr:putative signaling protein [bacterium HR40]